MKIIEYKMNRHSCEDVCEHTDYYIGSVTAVMIA